MENNIIEFSLDDVFKMCQTPQQVNEKGQIVNVGNSILNQFMSRGDIPADVSQQFGRAAREIEREYDLIMDQRKKMIKKHTTVSENEETNAKIEKVDEQAFVEEWNSYLRMNGLKFNFTPIPVSLMKDKDGNKINVKPQIMRYIFQLFDENK
jgi:hypothetical protein